MLYQPRFGGFLRVKRLNTFFGTGKQSGQIIISCHNTSFICCDKPFKFCSIESSDKWIRLDNLLIIYKLIMRLGSVDTIYNCSHRTTPQSCFVLTVSKSWNSFFFVRSPYNIFVFNLYTSETINFADWIKTSKSFYLFFIYIIRVYTWISTSIYLHL